MKILKVKQGTSEWQDARARHRCASEAPMMMGESSKCSRSELVRMKATGDEKVFSEWVLENLLKAGHIAEAKVRPMIEAALGEDLFPATASDDEGYLLASYDGLTMAATTGFEAKLWNEELAAAVRIGSHDLPNGHHWQLEQQILIGGLERVIFVCSDGTTERTVKMEYRPVPGRAQALLAGWKQFDEDVANYQHVEILPPTMADPVMALPALSIRVDGAITLVDNLPIFGAKLKLFVEGINQKPETDQDFANAEKAVKVLQDAQDALEAAEKNALAQTASIDDMRRTVAAYRDLARTTRLAVDKLVTARKQTIRAEILAAGQKAFTEHVQRLNERLSGDFMPIMPVDFAGAMKGKKTIAGLRDGIDTTLAKAKIAANEVADRIQGNLKTLTEKHGEYRSLFPDLKQLVTKANDDFEATVQLRVTKSQQEEERRAEAQRERIRAEERERAERIEREKAAETARLEKIQRDETDKRNAEAARREAAANERRMDAPTVRAAANAPSLGTVLHAAAPAAIANAIAPKTRPTDDEIVAAVALHFRVHESTAIKWLLEVDLNAASDRMATEFAG